MQQVARGNYQVASSKYQISEGQESWSCLSLETKGIETLGLVSSQSCLELEI